MFVIGTSDRARFVDTTVILISISNTTIIGRHFWTQKTQLIRAGTLLNLSSTSGSREAVINRGAERETERQRQTCYSLLSSPEQYTNVQLSPSISRVLCSTI